MTDIPRCATRAIRGPPRPALHLASETAASYTLNRPRPRPQQPQGLCQVHFGQHAPPCQPPKPGPTHCQGLARLRPLRFVPHPRVQFALTLSTALPCGGTRPSAAAPAPSQGCLLAYGQLVSTTRNGG